MLVSSHFRRLSVEVIGRGHRDGLFCPSPAGFYLYSDGTRFLLLIPADTGLLSPIIQPVISLWHNMINIGVSRCSRHILIT